ncbi:MAG: zinc ribbon domain-containing protein [Ignavibacteriales bacterium]|nr:zinc ribbon domain-containing protein [Ignavibacteriales bacterium]
MILLASFVFLLNIPSPASSPDEKLFCGVCGQRNVLTAAYCFDCGTRLDRTALIARLETRIAASDSGIQSLRLTGEELAALIDARAEQKLLQLHKRGSAGRTTPLTETEKVLNIIAPSLVGILALILTAHIIF